MNPALPILIARIHHHIHHHHNAHVASDEAKEPPKKKRKVWVRHWFQEERRRELSHYYSLLDITRHDFDEDQFKKYTRLTPDLYLEILDSIRPQIAKADTNMRLALEPGLKLAVTLRYLATGDSYRSLAYAFNVGIGTVSLFIPEVCRAIAESFRKECFAQEWNEETWRAIADKFNERWNMPHCMGALDGKHVAIKKPKDSGSLYHNHKGFFSIPILALVDADYKFIFVEMGGQGHMSDSEIFLQTSLRDDLEDGTIQRPAPCPLTDDPKDTINVPYFIVSDDAFALKDYCMKPYARHCMEPQELIFNYRLSRARRVVENAFGILAERFQVVLRTMEVNPDNVRCVLQGAITLHNLLLLRYPLLSEAVDREDDDHQVLPGAWRDQVIWPNQPDQPRAPRADTPGKQVRHQLTDFFGSPAGLVPWQWDKANVRRPENPQASAAAEPGPGPAPPPPPPPPPPRPQ